MASPALSEIEKSACITLSDLFLDTEIDAERVNLMAASLRALGMPASTLEQILRRDLCPILYPNLLSITGEWSGFDPEWLLDQVASRRMAGPRCIGAFRDAIAWLIVGWMITPVWHKIKAKLEDET